MNTNKIFNAVMACVKNDGSALQFVIDDLKNDD